MSDPSSAFPRDYALARALAGARLTGLPHEWAATDGPETRADAHGVQAQVSALTGSRPLAWKTGFDPQRVPIAGPIFARDIRENGGIYRLAAGEEIIVEVEIALRLGCDLPAGPAYSVAQILAASDQILTAIELVGTRYAHVDALPFEARLADNLNNAAFVPGEGRGDVAAVPRSGLPLRLWIDGACVADHPALHGDGEPLLAVAAWASQQADQLNGLKAGQFITTGSLNKVFRLSRAARIEAEIAGLGRARLQIMA